MVRRRLTRDGLAARFTIFHDRLDPRTVRSAAPSPDPEVNFGMDETSGRGHREKKPSEKLKEQVSGKIDKIEDEKLVVLPTYIAPNDPKFLQDQKEIPKFLDHTKIAPNGDKIEFYTLGTQYVSISRVPCTLLTCGTQRRKQREALLHPRKERSRHLLLPHRRGPSPLRPSQRRKPSSMRRREPEKCLYQGHVGQERRIWQLHYESQRLCERRPILFRDQGHQHCAARKRRPKPRPG